METNLPLEKKVGHLTLRRQPRTIGSSEFNALAFGERLEMVQRAEGKEKYQLICEAKDGGRLVKNLSSQDLLLLARDVGLRDFCDVLQMVTPLQFTNLLDFDCWDYDRLNLSKVLEWFEALFEGAESDRAFTILKSIDRGLLILIVKNFLKLLAEKEQDADAVETDDEEKDSESFKIVETSLKLLQNQDAQFFQEIVLVAVSESQSALEEEVFCFQQGRLRDQGVPDYWEARKIYLFLDPERFTPDSYSAISPGFSVEKNLPGFLSAERHLEFFSMLATGRDPEELMRELAFLVNKVMTADRLNLGDSQQTRNSLAEVKDYLHIASVFLQEKFAGKAVNVLEGLALETLFRLGFSLTIQLRKRAENLKKTLIGPFLDGPFSQFVACLTQPKPRFYIGLEEDLCGGHRPFRNLDDVRNAERWLDRVEIQRRLFENHFQFDLSLFTHLEGRESAAAEGNAIRLSDIFLTALANRLLGRDFYPRPIPSGDIQELHRRVSKQGKLDHKLLESTVKWLQSLEEGGQDFGAFCLEIWAQEFCPLKAEALKPDYIGGLLIISEQ